MTSISNHTSTIDCKCCDANEPIPIAPHNNIMTRDRYEMLLSGYTRNYVDIELPPQDIIDSCTVWCSRENIQSVKTYKEALAFVFKHHLCIKLFDFETNMWRSAVYLNHWSKTQRIQFRYVRCVRHMYAKQTHITIKDFPVNFIIQNKTEMLSLPMPADKLNVDYCNVISKWELNKLKSEQLRWKKLYQKVRSLESVHLLQRIFHSEVTQNQLYAMFLASHSLKHCYKILFTYWNLSKTSVGRVLYHFMEQRIKDLDCGLEVN